MNTRTSPQPATLTPAPGPAWHITTTRTRAAAIAAAIPATTTRRTGPGQHQARIPGPAIAVTLIHAGEQALTLTLDDAPDAGPLTLVLQSWTAADIMRPPPAQLPAPGHLIIRDIRIQTQMGRTVRYLIPAFTPTPHPAGPPPGPARP
jgi:hypothetical protein